MRIICARHANSNYARVRYGVRTELKSEDGQQPNAIFLILLTIHFTSYPGEERRGENYRGETSLHFLSRRGDERRGTRRDFTRSTRHATLHTQKPILDSGSKTVLNRPCTICIGSGICGARLYRCRIPVPDSIQNLDLGTTRIYDDTDFEIYYRQMNPVT